jgi:drug/metabolite transporter (DMT)-like permease
LNIHLKSVFFTVSAVLFWSTAATAFKLTLNGMNNIQLLFYSSIVSLIVLFLLLTLISPKDLKNTFSKKYIIQNIILGLANPFLYYLVLFKAYQLLPAQEAMPLNYTWPITISLFSVIFLSSKISLRIVIGMLTAFLGVVFIALRGDILNLKFHNLLGVSLAFGSSFIWAGYWILNLKTKTSNLSKLFSAFFYGSIFITVYMLMFDTPKLDNYEYLLGAVYIGLFEMSLTFYLWLKGLSLSQNKAKTATLVYISPFLSMLFIAVIVGESIFFSSWAGLFLIVLGIAVQHIALKNGKIKISLE